jgi:hypothetical protein
MPNPLHRAMGPIPPLSDAGGPGGAGGGVPRRTIYGIAHDLWVARVAHVPIAHPVVTRRTR